MPPITMKEKKRPPKMMTISLRDSYHMKMCPRKATALPKEAIGLKESPANYVPKSPKYVRDSEDEGAQDLDDDDTETPHLAPPGSPEQGLATQDIRAAQVLLLIKEKETGKPLVDYSSLESVPELVDSDSEVCSGEAPPKVLEPVKIPHKNPIDSKTPPSPTTAAVVMASPPQSLDASPGKGQSWCTPQESL